MPRKSRLDLHLLTKGLVKSREQAQKLIRAGKVRDRNGKLLDKPGQEVLIDLEVHVQNLPRFVSRGGEKLNAALSTFPIEVKNRICLDAGISTGGFTDCLLQNGATRIYGIDVGYGQIAWKLRNDQRVFLHERQNLRYLTPEVLYGSTHPWANLAVADLSFISLRIVLPVLKSLLTEDSEAIVLVKPQFEVGRERVGKGGIVREVTAHIDALKGVIDNARKLNWFAKNLIASPITGAAGNHEYLLWLGNQEENDSFPSLEKLVLDTLN